MVDDLKLGLMLGYWGANPDDATETVLGRRGLGFDSVWTAEAYGSDAFTPLDLVRRAHVAHQARHRHRAAVRAHAGRDRDDRADARPSVRRPVDPRPRRVRARRSSRAGTACRSRSRWSAPASTSTSCAQVLRARGAGRVRRRALPAAVSAAARGLGKPLKLDRCTRCATDIPIFLGAEGPKNVALATEIADGWLPIFYHVERAGRSTPRRSPAPGRLRDLLPGDRRRQRRRRGRTRDR